jgi:hypothetical protein
MKRSRFSEEQNIGMEQEAGRRPRMSAASTGSSATFYKWKGKFGGMAGPL